MHPDIQDNLRLPRLIEEMHDSVITKEGIADLDTQLKRDPQARQRYLEYAYLHSGLHRFLTSPEAGFAGHIPHDSDLSVYNDALMELAAAETTAPAVEIFHPKQEIHPAVLHGRTERVARTVNKASLFVAVLSLTVMLLFLAYIKFVPVSHSQLVGRLARVADAQWADASGMIQEGCDLYTGPMKLICGLAEIILDNGTKIIVQAPSEFELESMNQIFLKAGRLVVDVNKQNDRHFVVRTINAAVVDFGTEFGVSFDGRNTHAYVFQGEVEIRNSSDLLRYEKNLTVKEGQGGQVSSSGDISSQTRSQDHFIRSDEFEVRLRAIQGSAYHRWLAYSLQLRKDPSLAAYYTFEKDPANPDLLVNVAAETFGSLNGQLCSASGEAPPAWTQGRWPQKTALAFDRSRRQYAEIAADARLCINGPITLAAWIYCADAKDGGHIVSNRLPPRSFCNYQLGYHSPVEIDWRRNIHLARKLDSNDDSNQIASRQLPELFGWILVAVTHDNETLKFYLNGQLVDSQRWPHQQEFREAPLLIGADYAPGDNSRFNGKIDEIIIAKRVFSGEEIAEMYRAGRP
ncbi:MAG TPA: FecR domain-containing protein [Anaerohalosphaeraceae bacterium]|nr:FecR domain-containing protein [Anaerohalosphaeraceae bacterium]HPC65161.1 FecR domain-containing protein [Anaerohalosphaeraceae bacterium]HPO68762.1 FecR domain-containing protein [Anaerohalosphaeraceae bacterium]HRS72201.1 FecR domain-containing protein [Anaerohalosphaeraceae bacterium]HRV21135.1 FecR domain-containing protein [Anaerohalosphaeraceae bacterium]